jgi:hypothetical protein
MGSRVMNALASTQALTLTQTSFCSESDYHGQSQSPLGCQTLLLSD